MDIIAGPLSSSTGFGITSRQGGIGLGITSEGSSPWYIKKSPPDEKLPPMDLKTVLGFVKYQRTAKGFRIRVPYWSLILLSAISGFLPWIRWQFSLRTLLIAFTLAALVLGLIV